MLWIDFLRGSSAAGIVLFHSTVNLWVGLKATLQGGDSFGLLERAAALLSVPFHFTGSAVMLFFVISGFCIHYPYANHKKILRLKPYAFRRFLRIYPVYFVTVGICFLVETISVRYFQGTISPFGKLMSTVAMVQNYAAPAGQMVSNPALWSLPIEMEFYLLYPLFLHCLRQFGPAITMTGVACLSAAALMLAINGVAWAALNFALYWLIWCGGALLAEAVRNDRLMPFSPWLWSVAAIAALGGMASHILNLSFFIQNLVWSIPYFLLVWWGLSKKENSSWLQNSRWRGFLFLGAISYSLYLIHFPFFVLCGSVWVSIFGSKPASFLLPLLFSGLCVIPAYLLYRFVELPSHKLGRKLGARFE